MDEAVYRKRRQRVFLVLSGIFLGTLALLNVLGISRFIDLSFTVFGLEIPMVVAVGVLPYPVTFMCTDLISELFGEKKARDMVWVGLLLNVWVVFLLWLGGVLPGFETDGPIYGVTRARRGRPRACVLRGSPARVRCGGRVHDGLSARAVRATCAYFTSGKT